MTFLDTFLAKMFIVLIPTPEGVSLYAELCKKSKTVKQFNTEKLTSLETLESGIKKLERESAISYVSLLDTHSKQGLLEGCSHGSVDDISSYETLCIDARWGLYMAKDDIFEQQKKYQKSGLDFIFSPYSLLANHYEKVLAQNDGLYILIFDNILVSTVFYNNTLIFVDLQNIPKKSVISQENPHEEFVEAIESVIKQFYETKVGRSMFIEKIYIADAMNFDIRFENRLEETLFVEVHRASIDVAVALVDLAQKELS